MAGNVVRWVDAREKKKIGALVSEPPIFIPAQPPIFICQKNNQKDSVFWLLEDSKLSGNYIGIFVEGTSGLFSIQLEIRFRIVPAINDTLSMYISYSVSDMQTRISVEACRFTYSLSDIYMFGSSSKNKENISLEHNHTWCFLKFSSHLNFYDIRSIRFPRRQASELGSRNPRSSNSLISSGLIRDVLCCFLISFRRPHCSRCQYPISLSVTALRREKVRATLYRVRR